MQSFDFFKHLKNKMEKKKENLNVSIQLVPDDVSGMSLMEIAAELIFIRYDFLQMDI